MVAMSAQEFHTWRLCSLSLSLSLAWSLSLPSLKDRALWSRSEAEKGEWEGALYRITAQLRIGKRVRKEEELRMSSLFQFNQTECKWELFQYISYKFHITVPFNICSLVAMQFSSFEGSEDPQSKTQFEKQKCYFIHKMGYFTKHKIRLDDANNESLKCIYSNMYVDFI